jgi:hypothetical protein
MTAVAAESGERHLAADEHKSEQGRPQTTCGQGTEKGTSDYRGCPGGRRCEFGGPSSGGGRRRPRVKRLHGRHRDHYQYHGSAHHERWPAHEGIYEDLLDYAY